MASHLTFRNLTDERDYPLLLELNHNSRQADNDPDPITIEVIANVLLNMDGLTAQQGVVIASQYETPIGYSRLGWYSSRPETRLYYQISILRPESRALWRLLVAEAEAWLDEKFPARLANPENNPRFWQVAWDGNNLAGMVLARIDEKENEKQSCHVRLHNHLS